MVDAPITVSIMGNLQARQMAEHHLTLHDLAEHIRETTAPTKDGLPLLSMCSYGSVASPKGSLRSDENVVAMTGIALDYDAGRMSFYDAIGIAAKLRLRCALYTSPRHTDDEPRWRILAPLSQPGNPKLHRVMFGRLNGAYGGIFPSETTALSQGWYYGRLDGNRAHQVHVMDGSEIDLLAELDATANYAPAQKSKKGRPPAPPAVPGTRSASPPPVPRVGPPIGSLIDEDGLIQDILNADDYHEAMKRVLGKWAHRDLSAYDAKLRLRDFMQRSLVQVPDQDLDRWNKRSADIDGLVDDIYAMEARKRAALDATAPDQGYMDDPGYRASLESDLHTPGQDSVHAAPEPHDGQGETWQQPVDFLADQDSEPPKLEPHHVPEVLWGFISDTSERMGADPTSVALACIVACASVASDTWCVQPMKYDTSWTECARLWGAIVGDPSSKKSPTISACLKPLRALDAEADVRYRADMASHRATLRRIKATQSDEPEPPAPKRERRVVEGTTVEALQEILRTDEEARYVAPADKVLIHQDEMSEWVASLDAYKGGRGGDRGAYLRLYNGGASHVDRVGRGAIYVRSWSGCFIGGIQPDPVRKLARGGTEDGLLQRFMYAVPGAQREGVDRAPLAGAHERYRGMVRALAGLYPHHYPDDHVDPVALHGEAHHHREEVQDMVRALSAMPDTSGSLKAAYGKFVGMFARLALTYHLIEIADARARHETGPFERVISEQTVGRAADFILEIALPNLLRAHAVMFGDERAEHGRWIANYILAHGCKTITARDIVRAYRWARSADVREFQDVMRSLVQVNWLEPVDPTGYGREVREWSVNPQVHVLMADKAQQERARREAAKAEMAEARERENGRRKRVR